MIHVVMGELVIFAKTTFCFLIPFVCDTFSGYNFKPFMSMHYIRVIVFQYVDPFCESQEGCDKIKGSWYCFVA